MPTKPGDDERADIAEEYASVWEMLKNAPWDAEPLTEEDKQAIKEANEDIAAGRFITHEELKKELGL